MPRSTLRQSANTSRSQILWAVAFYGPATIIAVLVAAHLQEKGDEWFPAVLVGATVSTLVAVGLWFLWWGIWQIAMRLGRGAPFRIGDPVVITNGEHKGTMGIVSGVSKEVYAVRVIFQTKTDTESSAMFFWHELCRASTK